MKARRIFQQLFIVWICLPLLASCAFKDIDMRLFASVIGIDPSEDREQGYKVTIKVDLPFGAIKDASEPAYAYLSEESKSIGEAIRKMETKVDKVLELGQVKMLVIHEDLLNEDLEPIIDYFTRRGDIQLISYVGAARPNAEAVVKTEPKTEGPASAFLFNYFGDTGTESPYIITTFLFRLKRDITNAGIDAILPLIEANEDRTELKVDKSLVKKKNQKPLELDEVMTKYFNTLVNDASGFSYHVKEDKLQLLLDIESVKMNYKIMTANGKPSAIHINVKMRGAIGESHDPLSIARLEEYSRIVERDMEKKINELLTTLQQEQLDPFGFGLRYRATHWNRDGLMKTWDEYYPEIPIKATVNVRLKSTGVIE